MYPVSRQIESLTDILHSFDGRPEKDRLLIRRLAGIVGTTWVLLTSAVNGDKG